MRFNTYRCPHLDDLPLPAPDKIGWPWTEESVYLPERISDGSFWPKISVITPSLNQGQYIEETIRSVLLQGYPNLEYMIIDGGSTDQTLEIIQKYEPWLAYWNSESDQGQSHAVNKGIQQATGDILLWLNSDDICLLDTFRLAAQAFHGDPNLRLVIGQARLIDHLGQVIGELRSQFSSWDEMVTNPGNSIRQVSTFFSRRLFDELGLIDEKLHIAMDTELLVRFTQFHAPLIMNEYLAAYRKHSDAKSYRQLIKGYEEIDRTRVRYLSDRKLASIYRRRSAANWLNLSESASLRTIERINCLLKAVRSQPSMMFDRNFWSSCKKILISFLPANIHTKAI